jgi:hypothetical protein
LLNATKELTVRLKFRLGDEATPDPKCHPAWSGRLEKLALTEIKDENVCYLTTAGKPSDFT